MLGWGRATVDGVPARWRKGLQKADERKDKLGEEGTRVGCTEKLESKCDVKEPKAGGGRSRKKFLKKQKH